MLILGIDPGPTNTAWTLLSFPIPTYIDSGIVLSASLPAFFYNIKLKYNIDTVALEKPEGTVYARYRAKHLLETCFIAGDINRIVLNNNLPVVYESAAKWRKATVGNRSASDKDIAVWIRKSITNWPKISNNHTRDAAGCAYGAYLSSTKS